MGRRSVQFSHRVALVIWPMRIEWRLNMRQYSKDNTAYFPKSKRRSIASGGSRIPGRLTRKPTVELLENRELPATLQFSNPIYSVNEFGGSATVTVLRTGSSAGNVAVDYATSGGTAVAGSDYTATSGTLTFADGQTSATFTVPIIDDTLAEGNETINLTLGNPTGGATVGSPNNAVLTIQDDELLSPTTGAHALEFTHYPGVGVGTLSTSPIDTQASGSTVLAWVGRGISYFTVATAPFDNKGNTSTQLGPAHDYSPIWPNSGFALYNFPSFAGGSGNVFSVPMPVSDEVTFIVVEVKNSGLIQDYQYNRVELGSPQTTLSVTTTGPATLVSFWTGSFAGGPVSPIPNNGFTVLETQEVSWDAVQAAVATKDVSAAGTYDVTWSVTPAQTALMYLVAVQHSPMPQPGMLQLSSSGYNVSEDQGMATVSVTRTGGSSGAVSVNYATSDGTANAGSDYTASSGTLNFADGQTSATFNVPISEDALVEGNQTINLTLTNPSGGATLGVPSTATLTITDNDTPAVQTVSVNDGAAQRSMVTTMAVTFNTEVVLDTGAFALTRVGLPNGMPGDNAIIGTIAVSTEVVSGVTSATLTFSGANTDVGSLQDGKWSLTVDHTKVQATSGGAFMAVDFNQIVGHRLFGDADGNGMVTATDFNAFRLAYGGVGASIFDFDGDNAVSAADFNQFRLRYGISIVP